MTGLISAVKSALWRPQPNAFDPRSLEECAKYATRNPEQPIVISKQLRDELAALYGTDSSPIQQDPLKAMTGKEYIYQLGQASQRITWEQLQKVCQTGESPQEALYRLHNMPGLPCLFLSPNTLYDAIAKTVIGANGSKTPWAILRYHQEYTKCELGVWRWNASTPNLNTPEGRAQDAANLFAPQEMLAKIIGYAEPEMMQTGMIIPIWLSDHTVFYQIANQLHENGLHAYFLTPIDDPEAPAQMIFRGTKGVDSIYRDLDKDGIGKTVFDQCASRLLDMWKEYIKDRPNCSLQITGHSLGALDAQRMLVALSQDPTAIGNHSFKGFFFSSPKLDQATWTQWHPIPNCELNFAQRGSDPVTWLGHQNIGIEGKTRYYNASPSSARPFERLELHTRPFFPQGQGHPDDMPYNHMPEPAPAWPSSQVLQTDSQTSFQILGDKAPEILEQWGKWLEHNEMTQAMSTGSVDPSSWWQWLKA